MKTIKLVMAMMMLATITAAGQDLVKVAPKNAKVEYEDARVRVVRLRMAPNEALPMHERPARVVICLTANDVRLTSPDGATRNVQVPAGNVAWSGSAQRSVANLEKPLENIIVEIKDAHEAPRPATTPPSANDPRALIEPHHKLVIDNQYVRVYDTRIPPGEITEYHRHAYDTVVVDVSGGVTAAEPQGGAWGLPETSAPGDVQMANDAKAPRVHRVRNVGEQEFHVVLVQLKDEK